jgi:hypothetical protein
MRAEQTDGYNDTFFESNRTYASASSDIITRLVMGLVPVRSVVDFGCADGTWLTSWKALGVAEIIGLDGNFTGTSKLGADEYLRRDLSSAIDLGRRFDLVQCLEVAEHLPAERAGTLIDNLLRHGKVVLFSAAPPGQGGIGHINEQPLEYWRALFQARGCEVYDCVRPAIAAGTGIPPWYRYNTLLFVERSAVDGLSSSVLASHVPAGTPILDRSSPAYRLRKFIIRNLPAVIRDALGRWKRRRYSD